MFLALATSLALAEEGEAPAFPQVKAGGVLFAHYGYLLTDGADGYNEFAIDRAYVRADAQITKRLAARITLDADHMKATDASGAPLDTKYRVFLKHAYLEVKDLFPGVKLRAGMVDTPYTPFYDAFWGNRYITESFAKSQKLLETADLGVGAWGEHGKGLVAWNLSLLNGEGYGNVEVDGGKAVQARLTVDPPAPGGKQGLPVSGFVSYNTHAATDTATLTWAGATGYKTGWIVAWGEILGTSTDGTDGLGYSLTLNPKLPKVAGIVARYDHFDPDTADDDDANTVLLAGVNRDWAEKVSTSVTYERSWMEATADTPAHGVFVRMQAGW
jgi:hypothetical protein